MDFSEALLALKENKKVLRYSSDIELKFIILLPSPVEVPSGEYVLTGGLYQVDFSGNAVPYTPSTSDLLAEDWYSISASYY